MVNRTDFEPIIIDDFIHDPINQEKVQSYPPELVGRFNSFIVTAFDDSMTVEMQLRTLIKWIKENIDVTTSALDNMEAFKQDSMAFQNHVKDTLVSLINQFTDTFDDNLQFEMQEILKKWELDGYLQSLINDYTNERIDQLSNDVIKKGNVTMNDFDQETREYLANVSENGFPTVGIKSVGTPNIIDYSVTPVKTNFIDVEFSKNIWQDSFIASIGMNINIENGELYPQDGISTSKMIMLPAGTWTLYSFRRIVKYTIDGVFIEMLIDNGTAKVPNTYTFTENTYLKVSIYSGLPFSDYLPTAYIAEESTFSGYEKYNENYKLKKEITISRNNVLLKEFPNLKATLLHGHVNINTKSLLIECSNTLLLIDDAGNFYSITDVGNVDIKGWWSAGGTNYIIIRNKKVFVAVSSTLKKDDILLGIVYNNKFHIKYGDNLTVNGGLSDKKGYWSGKKWVSYGDSITASGAWQQLIVEQLGLNHVNMGINSSTIVDYNQWAIPMCSDERLNAIPSDTQLITIMGGTNDWAGHKPLGTINSVDKLEYYGAYNYIIKTILNKIPSARIILMTPPFSSYTKTTGIKNNIGLSTRDYGNAVKELGKKYNFPVIDTLEIIGANEYNYLRFFGDEEVIAHPNVTGRSRLAGGLTDCLKSLEEL